METTRRELLLAGSAAALGGGVLPARAGTPATDDIHFLEIHEIARLLKVRSLSSVELTEYMLRRIERHDPGLRSYAFVTPDLALAQAREADGLLRRGEILSPLHGVPVAVKDLFYTKDVRTAGGMTIHRDFVPRFDATAVRKLRAAGAVLLGKLQLTEGAFADTSRLMPPPVNPWNADYWPGGSSSGSGVATAAGLCFGSLGTDTGGSIRIPSAANGVTGLKPTWGRVSRRGVFELAASLDHVGPMCRSAADAAIMLGAIAGPDADDPTALQAAAPDYNAASGHSLKGFRLGFNEHYAMDGVDAEVQRALADTLRVTAALGATIVPMRFPSVDATIADWRRALAVEAAVAHEATFPSHRDDYGPAFAHLLDSGRATSAMDYQRILLRRQTFTGEVNAALEPVDAMLIPAQPAGPLSMARMATLGQPGSKDGPVLVRFTAPFDMSGHPTLTLPAGFTDEGLPLAVQFIGKHLGEAAICHAGRAFQRVTGWHRRHPQLRESAT
ncbi:MAG: amidase [Sphingopyxis sp.]|nr:amidase [Sphingopyxis sp.]